MNIKYEINPKYHFLRSYIENIPTQDEQLGEIIYKGRNTVFRNIIKTDGYPDVDLTIKSFKIPPFHNRIAYTYLRKSKAQRSYENANKLLELGIKTPEPIAFIEVHKDGFIEYSYYICLTIEAENVREWERFSNRDEIIENIAKLMLQLKENGVYHKDFSAGNILWDKDMNFYIIDINRMDFNVTSEKKFMHNFKNLNPDLKETERLARTYAKLKEDCDEQAIVNIAKRENIQFWEKKRRKSNLKNILHLKK